MKTISRIQAYLLTFICYVGIHSLRTAYSFSKKSLDVYLLPGDPDAKLKISIVDSVLLMMLGVGHFLHAVKPVKRPVRSLWIGTLICSLQYLLVPFLLKTLQIKSFSLLIILMGINGFLQSYSWPMLLVIIGEYFDKQKESGLLGFWSANANFGNIVGFLLCNILIQQLNLSWELGMYASGSLVLVVIIIIAIRIPEVRGLISELSIKQQKEFFAVKLEDQNNNTNPLLKNTDKQNQAKEKEALEEVSLFKILKEPKVILVSIIFSLMKSVVYGILLWIPLYFEQINYQQYKAYIPIAYEIGAIFGSFILGYIFRKIILKGFLLAPIMAILVALFFVLKFIFLSGIVYYFVIIVVVGFCLGGSFNTTAGLVTMQLTNAVPKSQQAKYLGLFAAIIMAIGNMATAATQLLIGLITNNAQKSGNSSIIFAIFMVYSGIAFLNCVLLIIRQAILRKRLTKEEDKIQFVRQSKRSSVLSIV